MTSKNLKCYKLKVFIKPSFAIRGKSFEGLCFASKPQKAKDRVVNMFAEQYADSGVRKGDIAIRSCRLYNGFVQVSEK